MILYIGTIISILLLGLGFWAMGKGIERDRSLFVGLGAGLCIVFAILTLAFTIIAIDYTDYLLNVDSRMEEQVEKRAVYVTMLSEVGTLMSQDVTASDTYFDIYDKVLSFNSSVRRCQRWNGTIFEGLLCDPTYKGLEIIPLN
jgi:hypothetical protein